MSVENVYPLYCLVSMQAQWHRGYICLIQKVYMSLSSPSSPFHTLTILRSKFHFILWPFFNICRLRIIATFPFDIVNHSPSFPIKLFLTFFLTCDPLLSFVLLTPSLHLIAQKCKSNPLHPFKICKDQTFRRRCLTQISHASF